MKSFFAIALIALVAFAAVVSAQEVDVSTSLEGYVSYILTLCPSTLLGVAATMRTRLLTLFSFSLSQSLGS